MGIAGRHRSLPLQVGRRGFLLVGRVGVRFRGEVCPDRQDVKKCKNITKVCRFEGKCGFCDVSLHLERSIGAECAKNGDEQP